MSRQRTRIVHIINSFEPGGAEAMLCNLVLRTDLTQFEPSVVALIDDLTVAGPLLKAGVPLITMGMKAGIPDPRGVYRLASHLRRLRPAIVQTWMDHSNLIGGVASRLACSAKVIWGVHHSDHVRALTKRSTLMTVSACARLSGRVPDRIVFCSQHARNLYASRGFCASRTQVIPNGFDTTRFRPDPAARVDVRRELGIDPSSQLVGLVARYDPFKDHAGFCRAAAILVKQNPTVHFLLCGRNVDRANAALVAHIDTLGLTARCHLLGPRQDVPRLLAALDVLASSSISEAFPLTVGEGMACGVACVATDVGDSALMVGDAGRIVGPNNPDALAKGLHEILRLSAEARSKLSAVARARVQELFELDAVARQYESLYEMLARGRGMPDRRKTLTEFKERQVTQVA